MTRRLWYWAPLIAIALAALAWALLYPGRTQNQAISSRLLSGSEPPAQRPANPSAPRLGLRECPVAPAYFRWLGATMIGGKPAVLVVGDGKLLIKQPRSMKALTDPWETKWSIPGSLPWVKDSLLNPSMVSVPLSQCGGSPVIAYATGWDPRTLQFAWLVPGSASSWRVMNIKGDQGDHAPSQPVNGLFILTRSIARSSGEGFCPQLIDLNGRPALAFLTASGVLRFAWTTDAPGGIMEPRWVVGDVFTAGKTVTSVQADVVAGKPVLLCTISEGQVYYLYSLTARPTSPWNWRACRIECNPPGSLAVINGRPAIAAISAGLIDFLYSQRAFPSSMKDWRVVKGLAGPVSGYPAEVQLGSCDGLPLVAFNQPTHTSLLVAMPSRSGWTDVQNWKTYVAAEQGGMPCRIVGIGRQVAIVCMANQNRPDYWFGTRCVGGELPVQ